MTPTEEERIAARRRQILDAAVAVIAERGFARTTIRAIARRAGVADGTIYNYFANKDALLLGLMGDLAAAEVRELHFAEAAQTGFSDFVFGYVGERMRELDAGYELFKALLPETIANAELGQALTEQIYAPAFAVAETYLAQLMADGALPAGDPRVTARLFASPLLGLLLLRLLGDTHVADHWDAYADALTLFLVGGIRPNQPPTTAPAAIPAEDNHAD